mmetsp:Transcript_62571/g.125343  ORF Transcript_62571/g.125343 Transcript_62571/m.125343 type:complete len:255 (-) Transcript_62571:1184-1948(-)
MQARPLSEAHEAGAGRELLVEGQGAREHGVQNDAARPHVRFGPVVAAAAAARALRRLVQRRRRARRGRHGAHFGCHVVGGPHHGAQSSHVHHHRGGRRRRGRRRSRRGRGAVASWGADAVCGRRRQQRGRGRRRQPLGGPAAWLPHPTARTPAAAAAAPGAGRAFAAALPAAARGDEGESRREAKVGDLQARAPRSVCEQQVLRLEVAVAHSFGVAESGAVHKLPEVALRRGLGGPPSRVDAVEELSSGDELEH